MAHQATQTQEAALVELSSKGFIYSSGAGSSVGNCFLMVPMKDDSLFSLQSYAAYEASLEYTEASAMSQEL